MWTNIITTTITILVLLLVVLATALATVSKMRRQFAIKLFNLPAEKIHTRLSIVIITKNNQKLLEYAIASLRSISEYIHEIVMFDLGSLDNTVEVARKYIGNDPRTRIYNIAEKLMFTDSFKLIKQHTTGELTFILDLNRVAITNPNVYVPELFTSLNSIISRGLPKLEGRIDGTKLLAYDDIEREKNSIILNDYAINVLSNIRMRIELGYENIKSNPQGIEEQLRSLQQYIDRSIGLAAPLMKLICPITYVESDLDDNLLRLFNEFGRNCRVSINYSVIGKAPNFKGLINNLILSISQDLLYVVFQHNITDSVEVRARYSENHLNLLFKASCGKNCMDVRNEMYIDINDSLSQNVLKSIQQRLSIIEGHIKINRKLSQRCSVLIQIPIDSITCIRQ